MALKTHRQGNDFKLTLQVYRLNNAVSVSTDVIPEGAVIEDLTEAQNIKLWLYCSTGACTLLKKTVNINVIVAEIPISAQDVGTFYVLLQFDKVDSSFDDGLRTFTEDYSVFKISDKSDQSDIDGDMTMIAVVKVGLDGKSAYQYAQEHGYLGTEEEFGQLQYDATLAAVNEAERVIAESNREQTFNTQMDAVDTAIVLVNSATGNANLAATNANDKATLANNAATNADSKAQLAETATSNADIATGLANAATVNANNAASNADAKATLANNAATNADNKAGLADQKATLANDAAIEASIETGNANTATTNANNAALAANSLAGTYNVTVAMPLGSGLYYNSATARVAVTTANRLLGRVITYATASGVWITEKFIGTDVANWTVEGNWERVPDNSQLVQLGADVNTSIADEKAMFPAIAYNKRVLADGGTVISKQSVIDGYKTMIDLLPNTKLLFCPNAGVKTRTSGIYNYITKAYDMGVGSVDLTQTVEANQYNLRGGIAPNEKIGLKSNDSINKDLTYSKISFVSTDSWSIKLVCKFNRSGNSTIYFNDSPYLRLTNSVLIFNIGGTQLSTTYDSSQLIGKTYIFTVTYSSRNVAIYLNGKVIINGVILSDASFIEINSFPTYYFDGEIYYCQIFNKALNKSEIESQYTYLRSQYPEIEGVNIGNQHWATSNYEGIVTGNGTVIPEVQSASTAVAPELIINGGFDTNITGYDYPLGNVLSRENDGPNYFLRSTTAAGSTVSGIVITGLSSSLIFRKWYKIKFKAKSLNETKIVGQLGDGQLVSLPSQITTISNPNLTTYWQDYEFNFYVTQSIMKLYFGLTTVGNSIDFDDISIKEVGWADLTTPAWCYYNNDPVLGSVYGKLYNYYAVQEIAKNPPKGWRVPTYKDFIQLAVTLGGSVVAGKKIRKDGYIYWNSNNIATNESGFSAIGSGFRSQNGNFSGTKDTFKIYSYEGGTSSSYAGEGSLYIEQSYNGNVGGQIRLLRNSPVGDQIQNISTGIFTTNIAAGTANKDLNIPFGYEVKAINVMATTAITNFKCDLLNTSGVLQQNLVTGKSASANVPIKFGVSADANIQYTDPILRFNCTGNSGNGLEIQVILNKIL